MSIDVDEIRRIIISSAGAPEFQVADDLFADTTFDDLGYESLALLESAAAIERAYGVPVPDDTLFSVRTPRELTDFVRSAQGAAS